MTRSLGGSNFSPYKFRRIQTPRWIGDVANVFGVNLIDHETFSVLLTGTLTTLAADSTLSLTAPEDIIIRGNIDVLGENSDLHVRSDRWVYQEGFVRVQDAIELSGGLDSNGQTTGGANDRGSSVFVSTTGVSIFPSSFTWV